MAATNRDLEAEIQRGTFRQDLYFRLNGITLVIPPLRERVDEIAGLAQAFLATTWEKLERDDEPVPTIAPDALAMLEKYSWPGNIRELRNVMERAALLCTDGIVSTAQLPLERMRGYTRVSSPSLPPPAEPAPSAPPTPAPAPARPALPNNIKREIEALEKQRIVDALAACAGNQTHAARMLGISRATLVNRLDQYGIKRPRKAQP